MLLQEATAKGIIKKVLISGGYVEKFSVREVIEQAVRAEKLGNKFYSDMARKFKKDKELKGFFEMLAGMELQHEKTFSKLKTKLRDKSPEGWEEVSEYLRAMVESEFFLGKDKSLPKLKDIKTVREAVRLAIYFEKETLLYYYTIRDAIGETDIIGGIIDEEKRHILQLGKIEMRLTK